MMEPRILKTSNLKPLIPNRLALHEMACAYAEEQFKQKGGMPATWLIASHSNVAWIETDWQSDFEKTLATGVMRDMLEGTGAQAYSFITEAWVAAFDQRMSEAEQKHWMEFSSEHGVKNLPKHMRDDVLMIFSHDREGATTGSRYIVNMPPRGPHWLGIRIDEELGGWAGRLSNLFMPERPIKVAVAEHGRR